MTAPHPPHATDPGRRRLALFGVAIVLAGALVYIVDSSTDNAVLVTKPASKPATGGPSIKFTDPVGFAYTMTAHQATETATGDPQNPVTPAPPGLNYIVIDATILNTTPDRPAPGDLSRVGLALEVPVADIAAAVQPGAYPSTLSTDQILNAGCEDLAVHLPDWPAGQHGYGGPDNLYGDDWETTADGADCLITIGDGSIIATPTFDGPGTLAAGASAEGDYVTVDPLPASIPRDDMRLTIESDPDSNWTAGPSVVLPW